MARPKGPEKTHVTVYIENKTLAKARKLALKRAAKKLDNPEYDLPNNISTIFETALVNYLNSQEGKS